MPGPPHSPLLSFPSHEENNPNVKERLPEGLTIRPNRRAQGGEDACTKNQNGKEHVFRNPINTLQRYNMNARFPKLNTPFFYFYGLPQRGNPLSAGKPSVIERAVAAGETGRRGR